MTKSDLLPNKESTFTRLINKNGNNRFKTNDKGRSFQFHQTTPFFQ